MLDCKEDVSSLREKLIQRKGLVNSQEEGEIERQLFSLLAAIPYFREHPDHLVKQRTNHGRLERSNVIALLKGKDPRKTQTVILIGKMNPIVDDQQPFGRRTNHSNRLVKPLSEHPLPEEGSRHLPLSSYMSVQKALDRQSGLAGHLYLVKYFSEHLDELDGNLVAVFSHDGEDESKGVLATVNVLKEWKEREGLEYTAAINGDVVAPFCGDDRSRHIYKGMVGKLMPAFYIAGSGTDGETIFDRLDPSFLAAHLTKQIHYNPDLCDKTLDEVTVPPISLKQGDLNTQPVPAACVYFHFFTHSLSPANVLHLLKREAHTAFQNAIGELNERYRQFCERRKNTYRPLQWKARVFTYEELNSILENKYGFRYIKHMQQFKQRLSEEEALDSRSFTARVVEESWKWVEDKSPAIILFFSQLYASPYTLTGKNKKEQHLLEALDEAIESIQPFYPHPISVKNYYPYTSDIGLLSHNDSDESVETVVQNHPGWGTKQSIPFDDIRELDVPVINIGPYVGKANGELDRLEEEYAHHIVPNITKNVIESVLKRYSVKERKKAILEKVHL